MNLTRTNWPLGWTPSADSVNGDPRGLLRMTNLQLDEEGTLTLVRGYRQFGSSFNDFISDIFSRTANGTEYYWLSTGASGQNILRSAGGTSFTNIASGNERACFGEALGQVLICAGATKKKDNLTVVRDLGLDDPKNAPKIVNNSQVTGYLNGGTFSCPEGTNFIPGFGSGRADPDPVTLRAVIQNVLGVNVDTIGYVAGGPADNPNQDTFYVLIQAADPDYIDSFRMEVMLETDFANCKNYYWVQVNRADDKIRPGINAQTVFSFKRHEFSREGDDNELSWKTVKGFRFTFTTTSSNGYVLVGDHRITGGAQGQINGAYQYAQQSVFNTGQYFAKSKLSPISDSAFVVNGSVTVTPGAISDSQANEIWIYRRSVNDDLKSPAGGLEDWYRVAVVGIGETYIDKRTDADLLTENIRPNLFLESVKNLPDTFIGIEGLFNERMIYLTYDRIYISDRLNPDSVDLRYVFKLFSGTIEKNLWIRKITNDTLLVATTKDLYEIRGTLLELPDGTLDIAIRSIGEEYPPLSNDCAVEGGNIFYTAKDGIRVTNGSNSKLISTTLSELFRNKYCHGIPPISTISGNSDRYPIAVGYGKLWVCLPFVEGPRQLLVYDFAKQVWYQRNTDPSTIHISPEGRVLLGYGAPTYGLWELDRGDGFDGSGLDINLTTVYDDNGQPRNRKDTFTLKIVSDTGGGLVTVEIAKDQGDYEVVGTFLSDGKQTRFFKLNNYSLGFRYSIRLTAPFLIKFKLYELTIEYEPRPEQLNYLNILPTNLGSISRKRFTSYAFVIDTLGNSVSFTPTVDNILIGGGTPTTINHTNKLTYIHYFNSNVEGTDIGGILDGGPFEFYGVDLNEIVSEKLPPPVKYLVIPANDYGNPNRKRHTSYKFQINTRGYLVKFTPRIDGINYASFNFSTSEKRTVEYFFDPALGDVTGIDIGGILDALTDNPFEFYGVIIPQHLEILPPRLKSFYLPETNLGTAARKRIRTIPFVINTNGADVQFTPNIDGVYVAPSVHNTTKKQTVYHYFDTDIFAVDMSAFIESLSDIPFEFYELGQFENVEILPVGKKYDQLGPIRFDKIGKLFTLRFRLIATGSTFAIPLAIYADNNATNPTYSGSPNYSTNISVVPNADNVYEVKIPHNVNGTVFRFVLGPVSNPFHRYDCQIRVSLSGMETDARWIPVR